MQINQIKKEAKILIAQNKLKNAIDLLYSHISADSTIFNNLIGFEQRLNSLQNQLMNGLLTLEQRDALQNNLVQNIQTFIDQLKTKDKISDETQIDHPEYKALLTKLREIETTANATMKVDIQLTTSPKNVNIKQDSKCKCIIYDLSLIHI